MLTLDELTSTAQLERFTGGAFAAVESVPCYAELHRVLLATDEAETLGTEVGLEGTVWVSATDLPGGTRVTIDGLTGYVVRGKVYRGLDLDHTEAELSARPPVQALRAAMVSLIRPGDATTAWDPEDRVTKVTPAAPYAEDVPATIVEAAASTQVEVAEEIIRTAPYRVTLHRDQAPEVGTHVRVDSCPGDATLDGRFLQVEHVVRSTQRIQRELFCSLI